MSEVRCEKDEEGSQRDEKVNEIRTRIGENGNMFKGERLIEVLEKYREIL